MSGERGVVVAAPAHGAPHVVTIDPVTTDAPRGDTIDQGLALREFLVHAAAAVVVWRSVAVVVIGLLPVIKCYCNDLVNHILTQWKRDTPEYDGLFAHIEVVFTQLVLHNHRNSRG